jgi:DNA-binding transcriptional ArsR family regulator
VLGVRESLDPDVAATAALMADPSRAQMLAALADGSARPAGELARIAGVSPQTASSHLERLRTGNLVSHEVQGRHRYYRLRPRVAEVLEALAGLAGPAPMLTPRQSRDGESIRFARTCYGHLAGQLGVAVTEALHRRGVLDATDSSLALSAEGAMWFSAHGIDVQSLRSRPLAKGCLDWSERRHHLAGALGVALCKKLTEEGWVRRISGTRALRLTDTGRDALRSELGLELSAPR